MIGSRRHLRVPGTSKGAASLTALATLAVLATLLGRAAEAATITNRDDREHKISILSGAASEARVLKPGDVARDVCPKGCIVRLGDTREGDYEIEGGDVVVIEDGAIYYESAGGPPPLLAPSVPGLRPGRPVGK